MPLPVRYNPSSSGLPRRSILSATPQQKFASNYNTMSSNPKANYNAMSCNSKVNYNSMSSNPKANFNAMSCNSKMNYNAMSCNSKFMPASERKHLADTRPLSDSAYHQECFAQILAFCSKNNYPLKRDQLNFMSPAEIEKLFSFILSFYEIKIKEGNLENEIPKVLVNLNYPYRINNSAFRSYATPKAKGVILSMFVYLIAPLMVERVSIFSNKEEDPNLEILKLVLSRNQAEKDNFIKQRMNEQLVKKNELESLIKKTEELKNELHGLDNQEDLFKLRKSVDELENQLKEFKAYEQKMETYVESMSKENEELKEKTEAIEAEIRRLNERKLELEENIKQQKHGVDEVNYFIQRDKQIQIEIIKMTEELKRVRQEYFQEKLKQDELLDSLKECCFKLSSLIRTFKSDLPNAEQLNVCLQNEQFRGLLAFIDNPNFDSKETDFSLEKYNAFLKALKQALNMDLLTCKEGICKSQSELEASTTRIKQLEQKNRGIVEQKEAELQILEQKKQDLIEQTKRKKDETEELRVELNTIDSDLKLKVKMAMNERMERQKKCEEVKKEFNEYWLSTKQDITHLKIQLKSIAPYCEKFEEQHEKTKQLNGKLSEYLKEERECVDRLMKDAIIR